MNPTFPRFRRLTVASKSAIERVTKKFLPYSDYYFFSLWSYNTAHQVSYSFLHDNLVIKFQEYTGKGYFYSFLGSHKIRETVTQLLTEAKKRKLPQRLKLVPEHNFTGSPDSIHDAYDIKEDIDNDDYIFSVDKLIHMNGAKLHQKKKQLKKFMTSYRYRITFYSLRNKGIHRALLTVLARWYAQTTNEASKNSVELAAIRRAIRGSRFFRLKAVCVFVDGALRGFTIFERVNKEYAILSFQKADKSYPGIFEFLNHSIALYLHKHGCIYMNMEQDLGIPGLRQAKRKYDPTYLKKYIISGRA